MKASFHTIIVGGGPAGGFLAYLLSRQGLQVTLLEAQASPRRKVCGEYLSPSGISLFENTGLEDLLARHSFPVQGFILVSPKGRQFQASFPKNPSEPNLQGFSLNRLSLEKDLLQLASLQGAQIRMGTRVRSIEKKEKYWRLNLQDGETLEADLLVGADGRSSLVAKSLGLTKTRHSDRVALHMVLGQKEMAPNFGQMHFLSQGAYLGMNPIEGNRTNASLVVDTKQMKEFGSPIKAMQHFFKQSPYLHQTLEFDPQLPIEATFPIQHLVQSPVGEQAALIGDAGGFLDPLTGEGIYMAFWSARTLWECLKKYSRNDFLEIEPALQEFEKKKEKQFRHKWQLNQFFQWMLKRPFWIEKLGESLFRRPSRGKALMGVIGHLYSPYQGIWKMLRA